MHIVLEIEMDENDLPKHTVLNGINELAFIQDLSECPEDAHIGRDLIDGHDIIKYLQMGWDACKRGEELTFEIVRN